MTPADAAQRAMRRVVGLTLGPDPGPHITRYAMNRSLAQTFRELPEGRAGGSGLRVLSISGSEPLIEAIGLQDAEITGASYPEHSMLDLRFPEGSFDVVVSDQVLEHVEGDPFHAVGESLRVTRPGGLVVHATCFVNPVHGAPRDCWRFTPLGLELLLGDRAHVVTSGGHGSRLVWVVEALGLRYTPVPHRPSHPLHRAALRNNPDWPVSTWVVARKT